MVARPRNRPAVGASQQGFLQVVVNPLDDLFQGRPGTKDTGHPHAEQLFHVLGGNDSSPEDHDVAGVGGRQQIKNGRKDRQVRSRHHRQTYSVHILLDSGGHHLLRGLVEPGVDHLMPAVTQRPGYHLGAAIMTVQTCLGNQNASSHPPKGRATITINSMSVLPLHSLTLAGQSIWADQISRAMLDSGELARRVSQQHITGVTSNPSIFAGAITKSTDYDHEMVRMIGEGFDPDETYAALITRDITDACDVLAPVHRHSNGADGFVSVEVSPELAADTPATVAEAREWVKRVSRPNLLVKVPATPEGIPAIRQLTREGISVNVTLIFSLHRYRKVMDAYLAGLEDYSAVGGDLRKVASVASFFVSRVDTEVDRRLESDGSSGALALRGKAAIANARAAYGEFLSVFSGDRWDRLAAQGGRIQRPLWASTSTKNPAYPDTLYVDTLVSPHTVNTLPLSTIEAYADHGSPRPSIFGPEEIARARNLLAELEAAGVDYQDVVETLERQGVASFAKSFVELQDHIRAKYADLR